jgi:hypothetical protein
MSTSQAPSEHTCRFIEQLQWSEWTTNGILRERSARRIPCCSVCQQVRPVRRTRVPVLLEAEATKPEPPPLAAETGRAIALVLARRFRYRGPDSAIAARGLFSELAARKVPASSTEEWLERFLRCGWVRLIWKLQGTRRSMKALQLIDLDALEEFAVPGQKTERLGVLYEARAAVSTLTHPAAREVARILTDEAAETVPAAQIRALAAVAKHVETGDVLAARVFSARYLDHSKALHTLRKPLEGWLGPLETLGIREGAAIAMLGGMGIIHLEQHVLNLVYLVPYVGLGAETLERVSRVEPPFNGLFIVENLAAFEACCRGEVAAAKGSLVILAGGYPSRAVRAIVMAAVRENVKVRVWCDLDLDGIRIARLLASWVPTTVEPFCMSPDNLALAPKGQPLSPRAVAAIKAELAAQPHAFLADTLRAILMRNEWVEQEAFLGVNRL